MAQHLIIATPVKGGVVTVQYVNSLMKLVSALRQRPEFTARQYFLESTLVTRARNAYATAALADQSCTHLLFIDSDMGFQPSAVTRMLDFDKPIVGCICPYRDMDYERFHSVARQIEDPKLARSVAQNYVGGASLDRSLEGGFARTKLLGMALTLIRRDALEQMSAAYPDLWAPADKVYAGMGVRDRVFQPFEALRGSSGLFLGEDISFAIRWTDLGGELWACADEIITHVGTTEFSGAYADRMNFEGN